MRPGGEELQTAGAGALSQSKGAQRSGVVASIPEPCLRRGEGMGPGARHGLSYSRTFSS